MSGAGWFARSGAAGVLLMGLWAGAARADLVVNGGFESGTTGWTSTRGMEFARASQMCGGTPCFGLPAAAEGSQWMELNSDGYNAITQTITGLTIGQKYLLSWAYAGRVGSGNERMDVSFGGTTVGINTHNGSGPLSWLYNNVVVTASASSAVLRFASVDVGGSPGLGNELDAISLNTYVPEPASVALCLVGVVGGVLARWRRECVA